MNDVELDGYGEFVDCCLDISDLENNFDGEESDDEPKHMYLDTILDSMPPLPSCPGIDNVNIPSQMVDPVQKIELLHIFDDTDVLNLAIGKRCLEGEGLFSIRQAARIKKGSRLIVILTIVLG